jgi:hypothetical protein
LFAEVAPELQGDSPDTIFLSEILLLFLVYLIAICALARLTAKRLEEGRVCRAGEILDTTRRKYSRGCERKAR